MGCDNVALTTDTSSFLGLCDLPPGPHFVWVAGPHVLSRSGYWFVTQPMAAAVRIKQWDSSNEILADVVVAGTAAAAAAARQVKTNGTSASLVPYYRFRSEPPPQLHMDPPDADATIWRRMTSCITERLVRRVAGRSRSGVDEWLVDTSDTARADDGDDDEADSPTPTQLTFLLAGDAAALYTGSLADRHGGDYFTDATPEVLAVLNANAATDDDMVGELQFSLVTGMHLGNPSCIDHWWHLLLHVVLGAHALVANRPNLCRALLSTVHAQLIYCDRYLDDGDGLLNTNLKGKARLRRALPVYKRRLRDTLRNLGEAAAPEHVAVNHAFIDLETQFEKLGWDLRHDSAPEMVDGVSRDYENDDDDDDDEYHPVVVQLDEQGREVGLVSWG